MAKKNEHEDAPTTAAAIFEEEAMAGRLADLERENAVLKAQVMAEALARGPKADFPTAVYRKVPKSERWPHGYETKRVETEVARAALSSAWVDSPADLG